MQVICINTRFFIQQAGSKRCIQMALSIPNLLTKICCSNNII